MKNLIFPVLLIICFSAHAQVPSPEKGQFFNFLPLKQPHKLQRIRATPRFTVLPATFNQTSISYWEASSFTRYSENGRMRSTHSFDVQGQLRETRASFSLKKNGALSYWRIQFSSRQTQPLFIYTIH